MIPQRIVVIGGSTVHGEGDPAGGGFVTRLKEWHETANPSRNRVFNLGIGGDRIADMFLRGPSEARVRRPNLIFLYPGLNDTQRFGSAAESPKRPIGDVAVQLKQAVLNLAEICPVVLISPVPPDESRTSPYRGNVFFLFDDAIAMTEIVSSTASAINCHYLDLFERWNKRSDLYDILADGLHCNEKGHSALFDEVRDFLTSTFRLERVT